MYGLALSITRDPGLAEDVSQEVFAGLAGGGHLRSRRGSALTWLLAITRNAALDVVRAQRLVPVSGDVLEQIVGATLASDGPEDRTQHNDESARAVARLRTLPPDRPVRSSSP